MIRAKSSVPHAIIRAELAAPPIEIEAITRSVSFVHNLCGIHMEVDILDWLWSLLDS